METTEKTSIVSTPGTCGGKPRVAGSRIRVQDIYVWHELQGKSPEEIVADFPQLSLAGVHAALSYYFDHQDEIKADIEAEKSFVEDMKAKTGPGPLEEKLRGMDAGGDSVSS